MTIKPGTYFIRKGILDTDDVFATGMAVDNPLFGHPLITNADSDAFQEWEVRPTGDGSDDRYIIIKGASQDEQRLGFGVDEICPGVHIKVKVQPVVCHIRVKIPERPIYSIEPIGEGAPANTILAVDFDTIDDRKIPELVVKSFELGEHLPGWIFDGPLNKDN